MKKFYKRPLAFMLSAAMAVSMVAFAPGTAVDTKAAVIQSSEEVLVKGSNMELTIGTQKLISTDIAGRMDTHFDSFTNQTYAILDNEDDYMVLGRLNNEGYVEALAIQPTCKTKLTLPGIYVKGAGDFYIWPNTLASDEAPHFEDRQIKLTLDPLPSDGAYGGYAFYSEFFDESDTPQGRPSDKIKLNIENGCSNTDESTDTTTASSVQVNGIIKTTGFCTSDINEINFGSADKPLAYAMEFNYQQDNSYTAELSSNEEAFRDYLFRYYNIEINEVDVNAYITDEFASCGTYKAPNGEGGMKDEYNTFSNLWVYNEACFKQYNCSPSSKLGCIGDIANVTVMTGGKIDAVVDSDSSFTKIQPVANSCFYSDAGVYRKITQEGSRITDFIEIKHNCELDMVSPEYDAVTNPHPNADSNGRYTLSYAIGEKRLTFESTSKALEIVGIDGQIKNGHFEINAGSGLLNEKGDFWAENGTEVTFTLVPDPGYQYKKGSFTSNGFPINNNTLFKATEDPGVYIYTMGRNACMISCEFEPAKDEITEKSDDIEGASIDMGENEIPGTMEFDVEDTKIKDLALAEKVDSLINDDDSDLELGATLDLSLTQKINTVTGENAWETPIHELDKDMTVSLKLDYEASDNEDYTVVTLHDGITEVLPDDDVSYDAKSDTLKITTDKYSTYVILYKKVAKPTLKLSKSKATLYTGQSGNTVTIKPTVTGPSKTVTWTSSNKKVATVKNGKITAVGKGTATITAKANGVSKTVKITVKNPTITIKQGKKAVTKATIKVGKKASFKVTTNPSKAGIALKALTKAQKKLVSASYKKGVLTVKGVKKGTVTLTIQSGKATKTLKITVK